MIVQYLNRRIALGKKKKKKKHKCPPAPPCTLMHRIGFFVDKKEPIPYMYECPDCKKTKMVRK
jgi:hypothetical protein